MDSIGNPGIPGPGGIDVVALVLEVQARQVTTVVEVPVTVVVDPVTVDIAVVVDIVVEVVVPGTLSGP